MKFIAYWLVMQLIMIGMATVAIENQVTDHTFDCHRHGYVPLIIGALFPLVAFSPDSRAVRTYCEGK